MRKVFGREPKRASQKVLDRLYDRACLDQRRTDLELLVAKPSQFAGLNFDRYLKKCAVEGIQAMSLKPSTDGLNPPTKQPVQEEEDEDGSWYSSLTSLGKSIEHRVKNLQVPAPMRGLPRFKMIGP